MASDGMTYLSLIMTRQDWADDLHAFLESEFGDESLDFLGAEATLRGKRHPYGLKLSKSKTSPDNPERKKHKNAKAAWVFEQFVSEDAPQCINISYQSRQALADLYAEGILAPEDFAAAKKEIHLLLVHDSLRRFKVTDAGKKIEKAIAQAQRQKELNDATEARQARLEALEQIAKLNEHQGKKLNRHNAGDFMYHPDQKVILVSSKPGKRIKQEYISAVDAARNNWAQGTWTRDKRAKTWAFTRVGGKAANATSFEAPVAEIIGCSKSKIDYTP